ncbi:hypothetical protein K0M31_005980 [Melipona bicolor]|uniref:Uncharacterized protein n=1 Tax=Melipona bicolor TaxID=60889 RepID=A0AA40FTA7_9HYME|nr:hypothetical protein K0M31_005980 [Melipona bicolor]
MSTPAFGKFAKRSSKWAARFRTLKRPMVRLSSSQKRLDRLGSIVSSLCLRTPFVLLFQFSVGVTPFVVEDEMVVTVREV